MCHDNNIISMSALETMSKLIKCSVCSGQCELYCKHQLFDTEYTVKCELCGHIMFDLMKEKVRIEGHRKSLGQNSMVMVYFCMQHDLGYAGMRSLCTSLGIPLMNVATFVLHENRLEELARIKYEEYSNCAVEAIFDITRKNYISSQMLMEYCL